MMGNGLKITFLGCGDSAGVPRIGGDWGNCDPSDPKNRRTRPSILVQSDTTTIVIDTGPDFGLQLTRENIKEVDAIIYTHDHSDHVSGIDDIRIIRGRMGKNVPIYLDTRTYNSLYERYKYMFEQTSSYYPVTLDSTVWGVEDFCKMHTIGDIDFVPFEQDHGQGNISLGFRFGDFGYSTDMRNLDHKAIAVLKGVKTWVADCADYGHGHATLHADFPTVQRLNAEIGAEMVYLTHLKMFYDYKKMSEGLPKGYEPAYDGLAINAVI
jgi:phosphoribosyl 1,2-cyclic phosphate phosphodiesterase